MMRRMAGHIWSDTSSGPASAALLASLGGEAEVHQADEQHGKGGGRLVQAAVVDGSEPACGATERGERVRERAGACGTRGLAWLRRGSGVRGGGQWHVPRVTR